MGEMKDRMLARQEYRADDPDLVADSRRAAELTARFNAELEPGRRRELMGELFGSFGPDSTIRSEFRCDYGYNAHVGAHVFVNWGADFLHARRITVGDFVQIGPNAQRLPAPHPLADGRRPEGWEGSPPITVADDVGLGGGVIVVGGVAIGARTVVGGGAVVSRDRPEGVLAVGNPARVVRQLDWAGSAQRGDQPDGQPPGI